MAYAVRQLLSPAYRYEVVTSVLTTVYQKKKETSA
jgi:hypothetical protein